MKISYYELLGMIKEGDIPNEVLVTLQNGLNSVKYVPSFDYADDSLTCYIILDEEEIDENYRAYLIDCFIEMSIFDKCIEIIEEEKDIEKLTYENTFKDNSDLEVQEVLVNKINEIIDEIKKLKKE